jgi:OOP family OmpA-OmpF porin
LRAEQVVSALLNNGVSEQNIQVQYFGATQPVASNATQEGRQSNRRVTVIFIEGH